MEIIPCRDNATWTTEGCLCACRGRIWVAQPRVGRNTLSTDTVNRLFLAGHGDLEEILSVAARETDRHRSLLTTGAQARQSCQGPARGGGISHHHKAKPQECA